MNLTVDDGIFSKSKPDEGSLMLLEELIRLNPKGRLCDLGSGYGLMTLVAKRMCPDLYATGIEINPRAVTCAQDSATKLGLEAEFITGDVLTQTDGSFDWIITNPPIRAGKEVVHGFLLKAKEHLSSDGSLLFVIRRQQGVASAVKFLEPHFAILERRLLKKGYEVWLAQKPLTSRL